MVDVESATRDDLTSITVNNEKAQSIIDDDVESNSRLDIIPVRDNTAIRMEKVIHAYGPHEVFEAFHSNNNSILNFTAEYDKYKQNFVKDIDEYDLEQPDCRDDWNDRFMDVQYQPLSQQTRPPCLITKHEIPSMTKNDFYHSDSDNRLCQSPSSSDIGRQITQLAQRIESLGNISRIYQEEADNGLPIHQHSFHIHGCEQHRDNDSLKTARKLDRVERLQKRQETMQGRLLELTRKLNGSTKDLRNSQNQLYLSNEQIIEEDIIRNRSQKKFKKSGEKSPQKVRKSKSKKQLKQSSFLNNILSDIEEVKAKELPLHSSSYYMQNDCSTGTPESRMSEATNKYINDELNCIRQEFRSQVDEIRKLLSERYQKVNNLKGTEASTEHISDAMKHEMHKSAARTEREVSPQLRNITNTHFDKICPLDRYLEKKFPDYPLPSLNSEFTPNLRPGILPSVAKAIKTKQRMLSDPVEAERFLIELSSRRQNLDNNINALERTKEGEFLFSILEGLQGDENKAEKARIQAMVDDAIASLNPLVNSDVEKEYQNWLDQRKILQQQQQQEMNFEQTCKKQKAPICSKVSHHINSNHFPPSLSASNKPWICKKYMSVRSKVDSGLKRPAAEKIIPKIPDVSSKFVQSNVETHPHWANRRRYRTPYLHFMNDVKLAKKPIGPLGYNILRDSSSSPKRKQVTETVKFSTERTEDLIPIGIKQYSLDYQEEDKPEGIKKPQFATKATSPASASDTQSTRERYASSRSSPTFSESGTGFQVKSERVVKRKEERVGPYMPMDPLDIMKITTQPINVIYQKPVVQKTTPDLNTLRRMIERAILDELHTPSPCGSIEASETISKRENISTPQPTEGLDDYSEEFSPESIKKSESPDRTISIRDEFKTPDASQILSEFSFKPSRVSTPSATHTPSVKSSPKKSLPKEYRCEAVQTICDNAVQTEEVRQTQTSPLPVKIQTSRTPVEHVTESVSTTSGLDDSLSDTIPQSFSDGMWLLDRSEGEVAPYPIENIPRWKLGPCPDEPNWHNATRDLLESDGHSSGSFGEFTKPTLPKAIATQDPVLQVIRISRKPRYDSLNNSSDEEFIYVNNQQGTFSPSLNQSRNSKSNYNSPKFNPRLNRTRNSNSDGEVEIEPESDNNDQKNSEKSYSHSGRNLYEVSDNEKSQQPKVVNQLKQNDTNLRDSTSDFMQIDPNVYLRASKQSHSDMSDGADLMNTEQMIKSAFYGVDSGDFEASSDFGKDKYDDKHFTTKHTVKIPTLGTVEQSDSSSKDDDVSEIILA